MSPWVLHHKYPWLTLVDLKRISCAKCGRFVEVTVDMGYSDMPHNSAALEVFVSEHSSCGEEE